MNAGHYILSTTLALTAALTVTWCPAVQLGDTRATVIDELGEPMGESTTRGITTLFYSGGGIDLADGRVMEIAPHFEQRAAYRARMKAYEAEQTAKGLHKYGGEWITQEEMNKRERLRLRKEAAAKAKAEAEAKAAAAAQRRAALQQARSRYLQQQAEQNSAATSTGSSSSSGETSSYFSKGGANRGHNSLGITKGSAAHNRRTQQLNTE